MTDIPFSFNYAQLVGNNAGCVIHSDTNWILKAIKINFLGQTGYIYDTGLGVYDICWFTIDSSLTRYTLYPPVCDPYSQPILTTTTGVLLDWSNISANVGGDLTIYWPHNGDFIDWSATDPQNINLSGSITI